MVAPSILKEVVQYAELSEVQRVVSVVIAIASEIIHKLAPTAELASSSSCLEGSTCA